MIQGLSLATSSPVLPFCRSQPVNAVLAGVDPLSVTSESWYITSPPLIRIETKIGLGRLPLTRIKIAGDYSAPSGPKLN